MTTTPHVSKCNSPAVATEVARAKRRLHALGWSYRRVAPLLGVGHIHLAQVLRGTRSSRRLLRAIKAVPPCPLDQIPRNSPRRKERAA